MPEHPLSALNDLIDTKLRADLEDRMRALGDAFMWGTGFYGDPPTKITLLPGPDYELAPSSVEERGAAIAARKHAETYGIFGPTGEK